MPRTRRFTTRGEPSGGTLPRPRVALPGSWVPALVPGCRDGGPPTSRARSGPSHGPPGGARSRPRTVASRCSPCSVSRIRDGDGSAGAESSLPGRGQGEGRAERSCGSGGEPCGGSRSGGSAGRGRARGKGCDSTRNTVLIFCMSEGAAPHQGRTGRQHPMRGWRNRQTRWIQVPVPERAWGFNSPLAHHDHGDRVSIRTKVLVGARFSLCPQGGGAPGSRAVAVSWGCFARGRDRCRGSGGSPRAGAVVRAM